MVTDIGWTLFYLDKTFTEIKHYPHQLNVGLCLSGLRCDIKAPIPVLVDFIPKIKTNQNKQ